MSSIILEMRGFFCTTFRLIERPSQVVLAEQFLPDAEAPCITECERCKVGGSGFVDVKWHRLFRD